MGGGLIALGVDAEVGDGSASPATEPLLSLLEGVLCQQCLNLAVFFHHILLK